MGHRRRKSFLEGIEFRKIGRSKKMLKLIVSILSLAVSAWIFLFISSPLGELALRSVG
jgi:hypothetical protein